MVDQIIRRINLLLSDENGPYQKIDSKKAVSVCLAYPDTYENGQPNLGLQKLYAEINSNPNSFAGRVFLPNKLEKKHFRKKELFEWHTKKKLREFDIVAFSISFESLILNMVEMLALARIPLLSAKRNENYPLVIAGGPCASYNPESLAKIVDAFVIGEGEEIIHEIVAIVKRLQKEKKKHVLKALSKIKGVYVPSLYIYKFDKQGRITNITAKDGAPLEVLRDRLNSIDENPTFSQFVTSMSCYGEKAMSIEVSRGCPMQCRFCCIGNHLNGFRVMGISSIRKIIEANIKYTNVFKFVFEAMPKQYVVRLFRELRKIAKEKHVFYRFNSIRADILDDNIVKLVARNQPIIIIAPETSEGLRSVINKQHIKDKHIFSAVKLAVKNKISNFGLYLMVGIPTEKEDDIQDLVNLISKVRELMNTLGNRAGVLEILVNPFFPKPLTPFQWAQNISVEDAKRKIGVIERELKTKYFVTRNEKALSKKIDDKILLKTIIGESSCFYQPILARGDRRLSDVLINFYNKSRDKELSESEKIDLWKRILKKENIDFKLFYKERKVGEIFPWEIINFGIDKHHMEVIWKNVINNQSRQVGKAVVKV